MVEIGYRYGELYWGANDGNWSYADYQVQKIRLALENALERRPKRRASTESTFVPVLNEMARVVQEHDSARFGETFEKVTAACNACHAAEEVPSFYVVAPQARTSPIRGESN
ncbi:MAG: cytochrome c [Deltaproteobacteria bacterium]|nr:cytochrome c [Deltaproteobacteria bacterium]